MVAKVLQKINNQPYHDVRKTKHDEQWFWYKKNTIFVPSDYSSVPLLLAKALGPVVIVILIGGLKDL